MKPGGSRVKGKAPRKRPDRLRHPELHDPEYLSRRLAEGLTINGIAKLLGASHRHVQAALIRHGISYKLGPTERTRKRMSEAKAGVFDGAKNPRWRGGRMRRAVGYVWVYMPDHPDSIRGYVLEHRLVAERTLGRRLLRTEIVHHINRIRDDNSPENLMVLASNGDHRRQHIKEDLERANGKNAAHQG